MAQVRLLLSRSDIFCRCCLSRINNRWCSDVMSNLLRTRSLSYLRPLGINDVKASSFCTTWLPMKFKSHNDTALDDVPSSATSESDTSENSDSEVEDFLKVMSGISQKMKHPDSLASDAADSLSSVRFAHELNTAVSSLKRSELLYIVSVLPSHPEISGFIKKSILRHFLKSLRNMSVSLLLRVMEMRDRKDSFLDESVFHDTMRLLEQRWADVQSGRDIVALLYLARDDSTAFLDRLEDRALDLSDTMTAKEIYRTVYCLARRRRRNGPLLRALMYCLNKRDLDLVPVHLANFAFALASLNVRDARVTKKLVEAVRGKVEAGADSDEETLSMISSVVQSLGILRWSDKCFMDFVVEQFARLEARPADWALLIHTLAWINYLPPALSKNGLSDITKHLAAVSDDEPLVWLDTVWACSVLDSLTNSLAASVLQPQFVSTLLANAGVPTASYSCKLLAVNAVAASTLPGYTGPFLTEADVSKLNKAATLSESKTALFNSVFEAFSQVAPADQYFRTNVLLPSGHVIDIMLVVNDCGGPQPLSAADLASLRSSTVTSPPTADRHRVAVQLLNYTDMTSGGDNAEPTGPSVLASRCFAARGFTVIPIVYSEFGISLPVAKRVKYLVRRVRGALGASRPDAVDREMTRELLQAGGGDGSASSLHSHPTPAGSNSAAVGLDPVVKQRDAPVKPGGVQKPRLIDVLGIFRPEDSVEHPPGSREVAERKKVVVSGSGRGQSAEQRRQKIVSGSSRRAAVDRKGTKFLQSLLKSESFLSSETHDDDASTLSGARWSAEKKNKQKSVDEKTCSALDALATDAGLLKDTVDADGGLSSPPESSSAAKAKRKRTTKSESPDVMVGSRIEATETELKNSNLADTRGDDKEVLGRERPSATEKRGQSAVSRNKLSE